VPDNGPAVAGFVFSLVSGSLLIISGGISTIISIACAIVGIIYSRKGKKKVDAGETPKQRGMAQAGFIIGLVSLFLSILATIAWALVLAFAIADDDFNWDNDPNTVTVTAAALRAGARIIGG
jgi:magnesium-transporting ATPase (P-type)